LLIVTHDAGDLLEIADKCWTLNHGQLNEVERDRVAISRQLSAVS
jgi:energy-coupling factor transport system ATP-binding protein